MLVLDHPTTLLRLAKLASLITLYSSSLLPLFDTSPLLFQGGPLLRWDAFHYLHIAQHGYVYEHEWAFFPGSPLIMRYGSRFLRGDYLTAVFIAALACETTDTLYALSLHHLKSPKLALVATLLSLLPTSPVTLYFGPCSEPFFTFLSYRGMLHCARRQWTLATLFFTLAGFFRSNNIFLGGFIIWDLVIVPFLKSHKLQLRSLLQTTCYVTSIFAPFIYHQYSAYSLFCIGQPDNNPEWCNRSLPLIYTHVQSKYWNVGLFRYWTPAQLPNFLLAAPTLATILAFAYHHLHSLFIQIQRQQKARAAPFAHESLTPHVLHSVFMSGLLLFASHTQITLRLAASMPALYWAGTWLVVEHPQCAALWVAWSFLWGTISILLWSSFLPPA